MASPTPTNTTLTPYPSPPLDPLHPHLIASAGKAAHENTNTADTIVMLNGGCLKSVEVTKQADIAELKEVSAVSQKDLRRRESKAAEASRRALSSINAGVSPEAQQIFDLLSKTMPCEWKNDSIVVIEQVRVDPPYTRESIVNLEEKEDAYAFNRICRMVEDFKRQVEQS